MSVLPACCFIVEAIPAGRKSVFLNRRTNKRRVFKEEYDGSMELDWTTPPKNSSNSFKTGQMFNSFSLSTTKYFSFYSRLTFARKHTSVSSFWLCGCRQSMQTVLKDNWVQTNSTCAFIFLCRWAEAVTRELPFAAAAFVFLLWAHVVGVPRL